MSRKTIGAVIVPPITESLHCSTFLQAKKKKLKKFETGEGSVPKRPLDQARNEPSAKRKRNVSKLEAQKLVIQFMIKNVKHDNLPEDIRDALIVLENCENEPIRAELPKPVKLPKPKAHNLSKVINPGENSQIDIKPVEKQDNCSGTEHMPNDYIEIEIQKYENRKKMLSKRTQTDKEGSQRNKEVTDRVFSDDFKCRSYTGMLFQLSESSNSEQIYPLFLHFIFPTSIQF